MNDRLLWLILLAVARGTYAAAVGAFDKLPIARRNGHRVHAKDAL